MINLLNGDCLELMKSIPDGSVDAVICDPPYGVTDCKWDSVIDLDLMWQELRRVVKPNGIIAMTSQQPFTTTLISSNLSMFRYILTWDKVNKVTGFGNAKRMPLRVHEDIVVFYSRPGTYNPQMSKGKPYKTRSGGNTKAYANGGLKSVVTVNSGERYPTSIIRIKGGNGDDRGLHPTQKPVALLECLIKTYSNSGETVLDFTMGSGSTGVAAVNTGRKFIGIELDKDYFEIAQKRIGEACEG